MARKTIPLTLLAAVIISACSDGDGSGRFTPSEAKAASLPDLVEIPLGIHTADLPHFEPTTVAVTQTGHFGYIASRDDQGFVVIVDSLGRVSARWGRRGEGPGEARRGYLLAGDTFFVFVASEPSTAIVFDPHGNLLSQRSGDFFEGFPGAVVDGSVDRSLGQRIVGVRTLVADAEGPIVRDCLFDTCHRELLPASDSILRLVHESTPRREGLRWPPYAAEPGRFVIGDGVNYRLWYFAEDGTVISSFGRAVAPRTRTERESQADEVSWARLIEQGTRIDLAERRALAATEPLPHFAWSTMGFDGKHRVWIVGKSNDSTFLDVFADTVFLGRRMIDCIPPGRSPAAVKGAFLVITCANDEDIRAPIRFRMFKIREVTPQPPAVESGL